MFIMEDINNCQLLCKHYIISQVALSQDMTSHVNIDLLK